MTILDALSFAGGIMFADTAIINLRDSSNPTRWKATTFVVLVRLFSFFSGYLPALVNGMLVIVMVLLAGLVGLDRSKQPEAPVEQREVGASCLGNRLFIPTLLILAGSSAWSFWSLGIIVAFSARQ